MTAIKRYKAYYQIFNQYGLVKVGSSLVTASRITEASLNSIELEILSSDGLHPEKHRVIINSLIQLDA